MANFTIDSFHELTTLYDSYEKVRDFLTSAEGGSLRVIEPGEYDGKYAVFRYVKGQSDISSTHKNVGQWRSVVWDRQANIPVCMAPAKAELGDVPTGTKLAAVQDFVDGVMVNLFVPAGGEAILVTRSSLGATGTFYSKKTFAELFTEAAKEAGFESVAALGKALTENAPENGLATFASFVLQHPEHRVVARIQKPRIYMLYVGDVYKNENGHVKVDIEERATEWGDRLLRLRPISYPQRSFRTQADVEDLVRRTAVQRGWTWQGLVFKDEEGKRWRIRSQTYQQLRALRGSEADSMERFLRLRRAGQVKEYLRHYHEERDAFWKFEKDLRDRTLNIFEAYRVVHKLHRLPFAELPTEYQTPVFRLHAMYLEAKKREDPIKIDVADVIKLVNGLQPYEQKRILMAAPFQTVDSEHSSVASAGDA
jgi:hypothetical protein